MREINQETSKNRDFGEASRRFIDLKGENQI